ncbi:putative signaling membrane protein containing multidomains (diguanylate cyclase (GGDEF)/phosphodiesterase (EAL)) [Bradyrhizobium sp. ORS 278]|uniref:putative bifunctional diguanylate cyclase/phosphodiesterase n=1 Tax=Bradyrhizobium sp. (strain ORS 278) TaxID=114615 RepID=UPI0001508A08|nr:EAL domain-containing protein [Bradyrhizobium sp. ORS 278]CAL80122.1 putative signaling membrane protein containing multidomains (diguanylate cyclase (GGDEF)/phosphodiesterase (EAL)) [Bradyrhizobium sp. ORS 278]
MQTAPTDPQAAALAKAQAASSLQNIALTLFANVAIATSLALLIYLREGSTPILWWLAGAASFATLRAAWVSHLKSSGKIERDPQRVLRALTIMALASGLLWSVVPLGLPVFTHAHNVNDIVFIMAGATTGAIIQSLAYSPMAIAFGAPLMGATILRMLLSGGDVGCIVAADIAFLTVMLFRAARLGERNFIAGQSTTMAATELADSLAEANQTLERLVRTDSLTGLANRSHFRAIAGAACAAGQGVAFLLFDVDHFKTINDTRGHDAGDRVLQTVAALLRGACGDDELPVRLGGDEFIVVLQGADVAGRAVALGERLMSALLRPVLIAGQPLIVSCSIGVAAQQDGAIDLEELSARADAALYRAKDDGRACLRVFDARMQCALTLQRRLDAELPAALARRELHVEFQPQVAMATQDVIGFEALLRWKHPSAGMIPPPDIVSAAIRLRLAGQLTEFVGERACAFLRALDRKKASGVRVSINVSPREFPIHSPAQTLKLVTERYGVDPKRIEIEVTEEAMFDPKRCADELKLIDEHGFALAIDDFGVGHSSIANLMAVEIDTVKIDRSFIDGIAGNRRDQQLVAAITAVALPLGHRIIAEGVEREVDAECLRMLGCSYAQGWLYGKPMKEDDAIAWLVQHRNVTATTTPLSLSA